MFPLVATANCKSCNIDEFFVNNVVLGHLDTKQNFLSLVSAFLAYKMWHWKQVSRKE